MFARAVGSLRSAHPRTEITVAEIVAPQRLAPFTYALGATVRHGAAGGSGAGLAADPATDEDVATGRLVLLYDPAGHEGWQGTFRLVSYVTAELEPELANDPLVAEVGWSWLVDALGTHEAGYTALAGTVTRTTSTRFGGLAGPPPMSDVEIRASWTPLPDPRAHGGEQGDHLDAHLLAWCSLLASTAGLPPPGVSALR